MVERLAETGAQADEIRAVLGIPAGVLDRNPEALLKFRTIVGEAHLKLRVRVREQLLQIAKRGTRGKSVTAALALARNLLSWDQSRPALENPGTRKPDSEGAVAELEQLLSKMRPVEELRARGVVPR